MSMTPEERLLVRDVACKTCTARIGAPCRTPKGKALSRPHAARVRTWHLYMDHPQHRR